MKKQIALKSPKVFIGKNKKVKKSDWSFVHHDKWEKGGTIAVRASGHFQNAELGRVNQVLIKREYLEKNLFE